ncbi:hypothetical protein GCM10010922_21980 [Microbacterium sorbitolivorans]|uniref:DUF4129 domain-containing protein n=1 Tax=Microbacterium sorbitolivorans TaxID=1867410 RepID=A0A367XUA4_9MICO|nr:DUF4129 domain-containing protein [Microbacterium sorbitolivorans]RCK57198.1 DUF4129 domain-containing protein [Microbacterium sorbitolivorans]GGF45843.1 hypothetical protein GCM10010922_21980 [Microbacterium sorbitolivorans]
MISLAALPDADEAREWAEEELSKAVYQVTEPTLFDKVARAIGEFVQRLLSPNLSGGAFSPIWAVIIVAIVLGGIVLAFVIWGRPRGDHRTGSGGSAAVFDDDALSAAELRAASAAAAARGDWDEAIVMRFRALARGLDERGILHAPPGMTARALAADAGVFFPNLAGELAQSAALFDDVRYLRRHGSADAARALDELEARVAAASPAIAARAAFA